MDDISRALCGAYKDILKTGIAQAKTGSALREAKREAYRQDPTQVDSGKRQQDIEAQKAYLETVAGKDYDKLIEEAEAEKEPVCEKKINDSLMDSYLKVLPK